MTIIVNSTMDAMHHSKWRKLITVKGIA